MSSGRRDRAWRVLLDGALDGALNMAVDRAVLTCVEEGASPPTVRLYRWSVPTVTLGRFQRAADVDWDACRELGFDAARRPTGGRGVLHDDETTYAFVASVADGVPRGTAASYAHLCEPLAVAMRSLGVAARLSRREAGSARSGACYLHATRADLSAGEAKLSGSAQVWHRDTVLQHGSVVISRDVDAESRVFRLGAGGAGALAAASATLSDLLDVAPGRDEVEAAVLEAVSRSWGIELEPGGLTEREAGLAAAWRPEHQVEVTG